MKAIIVLALAALVSGCVTTEPQIRTVTHEVLVPVPCEPHRPKRPVWAVDSLPIGSKIDAQMRALRADRHRAMGFIGELEAALDSCSK